MANKRKSQTSKIGYWLGRLGPTRLGVLGVVLAFVGCASFYALSTSWSGAADAKMHVDYVWQVSQGELPDFHEGSQYKAKGFPTFPVQYVAQHPPLFYALLSVPMKPLLQTGNWHAAVLVGRVINIVLGVLCVLALAWTSWLYGGRWREQLAVAAPATTVLMFPFVRVAGDVYNDMLMVLTATLALSLIHQLITKGPTLKYLLLSALTAMVGMSTRASFISVLALQCLAIVVAVWLHSRDNGLRKLVRGSILSAVLILGVVAVIGWFYWQNYQASGSWARAVPQSWIVDWIDRPYKSLAQVLFSRDLWTVLPARLLGLKVWEGLWPYNNWLSGALFAFSGIGAVIAFYRQNLWQVLKKNRKAVILTSLLGLHVLLMIGQQIDHAVPYGLINPRYLLPMILPLGLVMGFGNLAWKRLRGMSIPFIMFIMSGAVVLNAMWQYETPNVSALAQDVMERNSIPAFLLASTMAVASIGIGITAAAMWQLTDKKSRSAHA